MSLSPGSTFAGYEIVRLLGSGGMGEVYLAKHPRLPRRDALKVLPADISSDPEYRERFSREADLAAGLWHPNIVGVLDRGEHEDQLWITMEYVPGLNLADLLRQRYPTGMPVVEVGKIVSAIGDALDYAHSKGLLHRDVKPANIMISEPDGSGQRIMLADFGIARTIGEISGLTATNMTVGTVAYAAPEQLMGEHLDGRADQYALAATAYHLLTCSQLFPDTNPAVVIARHLNAIPPQVADSHPELVALDRILTIALSKNPQARFPKCSDFTDAFISISSLVINRLSGPQKTKSRTLAKLMIGTGIISVALLLTAGLFSGVRLWKQGQQPSPQLTTVGSLEARDPKISVTITDMPKAENSANPTTSPTPIQSADISTPEISAFLLSDDDVNRLAIPSDPHGTAPLESAYGPIPGPMINTGVVPFECVTVQNPGDLQVYSGTGYEKIMIQRFQLRNNFQPLPGGQPASVEQAIAVFPSSEGAENAANKSMNLWRSCSNFTQQTPSGSIYWHVRDWIPNGPPTSPQKIDANEDGGHWCSHRLQVRRNVLVEISECFDGRSGQFMTDTSFALIKEIIDRIDK